MRICSSAERALGGGPDAVQAPHRQRGEESEHPLRRDDGEAVGLLEVGGDLRDQPVGADADAHASGARSSRTRRRISRAIAVALPQAARCSLTSR